MNLKTLDQYPQHLMGDSAARTMIVVHQSTDQQINETFDKMQGAMPIAIMHKRLTAAAQQVHIDKRIYLYLSVEASNPGRAVLWAHTLYCRAKACGNMYTWEQFLRDFANGFPDKDSMRQAWDAQKNTEGFGGNYLDSKEAWV